jgi:heat-inducible transcriptional repressor
MGSEGQIGPREHEILTAIVESYIATGEPVGSRVLARVSSEGLSPASIRNVMSDLVDSGFLEQPHTSAGRVPTPAAYQYYVNQLSGNAQLSPSDEGMVRESLQGVSDVQEFMERTSHVLSLISHNVGVTITAGGPKNALDHVYFSRLGDKKILAVVVMKSGVVRDRVLRMSTDLSQQELEFATRFINDNFRGWTLPDVRNEIERRVREERNEYDRLINSIDQLCKQGALASEGTGQGVYLEGAASLVANEADRDRLQQLLKTLEEKERLAQLLSAYLDTKQEAVRVVIGLEEAAPYLRNFVLIGAPARVGGEVMGSLAVLGPTRMDYQHTMNAVAYIAKLFDQVLNDSE